MLNHCRFRILRVAFMSVALTIALSTSTASAAPPNILFLFADDYCFDAIAAFEKTDIETPHLDRLVHRGTTFTHAYNMGSWSGAVCVASRTMLITGRSVWRAHAVYNTTDQERAAGRLWPQLMSQAGYKTYFTGKWHIQAKAEKAFDVVAHVRAGMPKDTPEAYNRPLADQPDPWSASDPKFGGYWAGGKHWSEVVADDTIDFLSAAKTGGQPFFIYAAFNAPHDPRQSPPEYLAKYPLDRIAIPPNFRPEYPFKDAIGCPHKLRDEHLAPMPRTEQAVRVHRREYYALITHLDAQIGRILAALEQSGQADNTWIFFTADHGLAVGKHGLWGKQNMYEHSLRVPFIVVGPEVKADAKIERPIYLQDVMATSLDLAGVAKPEQVEFHSLLPMLRGTAGDAKAGAASRDTIYGAYLELQRAIIHDGWKLIVYPQAKAVRLYHVAADPDELTDLADLAEHRERVRGLFARLLTQQKELGDRLDLTATFPQFVQKP